MVRRYEEPSVGDRVIVPWGLEEVLGEVVEVYSTGFGDRAKVRVVDDPDGPTVSVPIDSLITASESESKVAAAVVAANAAAYEEQVESALGRCIATLRKRNPNLEARPYYDFGVDHATDFEWRFGKRRLLIEAKYSESRRHVSTDTILTFAGLTDPFKGVLLVANANLAPPAAQRIEQLWHHRTYVRFALWRDSKDDARLRDAVQQFLLLWKLDR